MQIIIDSNYLCHRSKHGMVDLSFHEQQTGILFAFIRQILYLSKRFKTNDFIFAWDSRKSYRKVINPEYKNRAGVQKTEEERMFDDNAFKQFNILRQTLLPELGFNNNFIQTGHEADDIIASIVQDNTIPLFVSNNLKQEQLIYSADHDLYQLLTYETSIFNPMKKVVYTRDNFESEFGIVPQKWAIVKAMAGCTSDTVEGIRGVGEKTAIKYLLKKLKVTTKAYKSIAEADDLINRNMKLVALPFKGTKQFEIKENELDYDKFMRVCRTYDFRSLMTGDSIVSWRKTLEI